MVSSLENASWRRQCGFRGGNQQAGLEALVSLGLGSVWVGGLSFRDMALTQASGSESSPLLLCGFSQAYGCLGLRSLEEHTHGPLVLRTD